MFFEHVYAYRYELGQLQQQQQQQHQHQQPPQQPPQPFNNQYYRVDILWKIPIKQNLSI
jgi:hypothetical protein